MKISLAILLCFFLSACSILKASPAPDAGFLPHEEKLEEMRERAPFNASWVPNKEKLDALKKTYKIIVVEPVITEFVAEKIEASDSSPDSKLDDLDDVKEIARYLHEKMVLAFKEKGFETKTEAVPDSFVWVIALTELEPTLPAVNIAATAAGVFIPGAGVISRAGTGSIAIEGMVRDGNTGELLAAFKDRESDKNSPFTIRDFQRFAHSRAAIDEWAEQFAELASTPEDHKVEDSSGLTLNPI